MHSKKQAKTHTSAQWIWSSKHTHGYLDMYVCGHNVGCMHTCKLYVYWDF